MGSNDLLSADELALLTEVMAVEGELEPPLPLNLPYGSVLLPLMERADGLVLVANYRHHLLRFPVRLQRDEFGRLALGIDAPEILETGPTTRNWRVRPLHPLRLLDSQGQDTGLRIHDLSISGLALTFDHHHQAPELLNLQLELPDGGDLVPLEAALVRQLDHRRVAYRLVSDDDEPFDRLRWFLFHQHRALHPDRDMAVA